LAAIIHSASTSKENVDHYITQILFGDDEKYLLNLIEAVKKIRVMVRGFEPPHRDIPKTLEKKLEGCRNPENNSDDPAYKRRMKESFEDEENWQDGQYSARTEQDYN